MAWRVFLRQIAPGYYTESRRAVSVADFTDILASLAREPDIVDADAGDARVTGGLGFDFASWGDSDTGVVTALGGSIPDGLLPFVEQANIRAPRYVSVEGLIGSGHDDVLIGDRRGNVLFGANGDDLLIGGGRADLLIGGGDDDILIGGRGPDILIGGPGGDSFTQSTTSTEPSGNASQAPDTIVDFEAGVDRIVFILPGAGAGPTPVASGAFRASADGTAQDADDIFLYDTTNGRLSYDADGSGAADAIQIATLLADPTGHHPDLTAADMFVGQSTEGTGI